MRHERNNSNFLRHDHGFTLIEVLVAVLVLSIGLLGLAGLQASGLRNNYDAYLQTQATNLANDFADRIRANRSAAALATYAAETATANAACFTATGCAPTAMAAADRDVWNSSLTGRLPAGQGSVGALGGGLFSITVRWDEGRTGVTGTACNPNDPTDLRCLTIITQP